MRFGIAAIAALILVLSVQTSTKIASAESKTTIYTPEDRPEVAIKREEASRKLPPTSLIVEVTAYCIAHQPTTTGIPVHIGVCAVDPSVIPLGSILSVPDWGMVTACDIGGLVKGNTIDIWMPKRDACLAWGRKVKEIKIIRWGWDG